MRTHARSAVLALALALGSCASVRFARTSESSGTFESSAFSFTLLSVDVPKQALQIANENASDGRRPNMVVERTVVYPHLGPLDWLLDLVGFRWAKVNGTWGFEPEERASSVATNRSIPGS